MMQLLAVIPKRILFVGISVLLLAIGLFVTVSLDRTDGATTDDSVAAVKQSATNREARRVFVQDFETYQKNIDTQTRRWIEHSMYKYVSQDQPDLYTGVIRSGSYTEKTASDGLLNIEFLIDIEPSKVTYKSVIVMRPNTDFQNVTIACAPPEFQIARSTDCKDGDDNE